MGRTAHPQRAAIFERIWEGAEPKEIVAEFGIHQTLVYRYLAQMGLILRHISNKEYRQIMAQRAAKGRYRRDAA